MSFDEPWTCNACGTGNVGRAFCEQCGRQRGWTKVSGPDASADEADVEVPRSRGPLVGTLVTLLVIAAAVAAVVALTRTSSDQKLANRAVLERDDLGGGWDRVHPPSTNAFSRAFLGQQAGACAKGEGPGAPKASASTAFRNGDPKELGITRVGLAVLVYGTSDQAGEAMTYFATTPFADCLAKSLQEDSGHDNNLGATLETQSLAKLPSTTAAAAETSLQLRAVVRLATGSASVDMTVDIVITRVDRTVTITSFHSDTGPFQSNEEARLVSVVASRVR